MPLKRLDQMTLAEAQERIAQTDIAFFPQGPTEGHGLHMPLGCDCYVATAAAMLLAERTGGICPRQTESVRQIRWRHKASRLLSVEVDEVVENVGSAPAGQRVQGKDFVS